MTFVDRVRISVRGGDGGAGVAGFERVKGRPRGKPTGGSGGSGGAVVLEADPGAGTLLRYARRPHWRGGDGGHGEGDLRHGAHGDDVVLVVPLGTVVKDDDGTILADLVEPGQRVAVVTGGRGGKGNAGFVTPQRKAPTFAEQGEYGEERWVILELKVLADAALVGFPNVGKSTLISKVSAARPKVADYPFTTLSPHLGVVEVSGREFTLADVPGLIEGAAEGKGLGHEFLRHVERAAVLVVLLDPTALQERDVADQLEVLSAELVSHAPELADRPRLVAVNKIDAIDVERLGDIRRWAEAATVALYEISAITGDGVDALLHAVADEVIRHERSAPDREGFVLHRPLGPGFVVTREGDTWVVAGRAAERAVNLADLTSPEAAAFASDRLAKIGVDQALRAAGARAGDDVRIGELTFTFDPHLVGDTPEKSA
ncbi:MAG TPA: GTPase ObgE [Acidimicrobiia bacterium]|jgi:GTP-binding protein